MERLTERYKEMVYYARCYDGMCNDHCNNEMLKCEEDALNRLAEYEDTEITPEQILKLDKLYSEKCRELAGYKRQLQKEWIPCSERIPEEGKRVLVWFEYFRYGNYNKPFQTWGISYTIDEAWSGFVNGQSGWKDLKILAWMPLPEPFKETIQDCKDSKRLAEREKFFRD